MERNTPAAERKRRINEVLDELELTKCSNSRIGNRDLGSFGISGGESRRLSFAAEVFDLNVGVPDINFVIRCLQIHCCCSVMNRHRD